MLKYFLNILLLFSTTLTFEGQVLKAHNKCDVLSAHLPSLLDGISSIHGFLPIYRPDGTGWMSAFSFNSAREQQYL
jgi:hypothetical protein